VSGGGLTWATAHYRMGDPGVMRVTGDGIDEDVPIPVGLGERPTTRAANTTVWTVTPGQQWREDGGLWTVAVYRHA
jgi:hypothetical protein